MKIADVTVGTEYAATSYVSRYSTEQQLLEWADRVVVRSILTHGKIRVSRWDREAKAFYETTSQTRAANLVMPWAEAVSKRKAIREQRIADGIRRQEQVAREQVALANGDEGLKDLGIGLGQRPTHRHEPKIEVNVITLVALLRMAYRDGFNADGNGDGPESWSLEVS